MDCNQKFIFLIFYTNNYGRHHIKMIRDYQESKKKKKSYLTNYKEKTEIVESKKNH